MDWSKEEIMFHDCWPRYFAIVASSLNGEPLIWRAGVIIVKKKIRIYFQIPSGKVCSEIMSEHTNHRLNENQTIWPHERVHVGYLNKDIELKRNRRKLTVIICFKKIYQKRGRDGFKTEILLLEISIKIMTDHRGWQIRIFTALTLAASAFTPVRIVKYFTL